MLNHKELYTCKYLNAFVVKRTNETVLPHQPRGFRKEVGLEPIFCSQLQVSPPFP